MAIAFYELFILLPCSQP